MAIEIRELIIKTIEESQQENPVSDLEIEQIITGLKQEILAECKELILEILEKRDQQHKR